MNDMHATIIPKSDQLNADDLIGREMTIKITGVTITPGEQPVAIHFDGDNGKPYKACKSMCRVMVSAWGSDSKKYIGRSMTLYRDAKVKWGGMEVGGIRISHMSDIGEDMTMALTVTRANKKPFTVRPLLAQSPKATPQPPSRAASPSASAAAVAPTLQATLAAIDAMKGQKSAAACIDMLAELDEAERLIAQEAYDFRVAELKAASKPKQTRDAAHNAVLAIEDDKL